MERKRLSFDVITNLLNYQRVFLNKQYLSKKVVITMFPYVSETLFAVLYKGNAVPSQAWSGSEDSRKLRFPDFMTMKEIFKCWE